MVDDIQDRISVAKGRSLRATDVRIVLVSRAQDAHERSRVACDSIRSLSLYTSMNKNNAQVVELVDDVQDAQVSRAQDAQERSRVACDSIRSLSLYTSMNKNNAQVVELVDTLS